MINLLMWEEYIDLPNDMLTEASMEETELQRIIQTHFLNMPDDCQKVLRLFIQKVPVQQIAGIMGFKTGKYTRARKDLCKENLKTRIANDPRNTKFLTHEKPN